MEGKGVKAARKEQVMKSKAGWGSGRAGQSVFNWLCRLEGQRSRAQHAAVTLHYSHWPHNESLCNQLPTDRSLKPLTYTVDFPTGSYQMCSLSTHLPVFPDANLNTWTQTHLQYEHRQVKWQECLSRVPKDKVVFIFRLDIVSWSSIGIDVSFIWWETQVENVWVFEHSNIQACEHWNLKGTSPVLHIKEFL